MDITTPAILFPAISLLFLSYTNKFLALASLIRQLTRNNESISKENLKKQIGNLERRIKLIKYMQLSGVVSFLICAGSMLALHHSLKILGETLFGFSMALLLLSLVFCFIEIFISTKAINLALKEYIKE